MVWSMTTLGFLQVPFILEAFASAKKTVLPRSVIGTLYLLAINEWMKQSIKSYFCFPQRKININSTVHGIFSFVLTLDDPLPLRTCRLLAWHSQRWQKAGVAFRLSTYGASKRSLQHLFLFLLSLHLKIQHVIFWWEGRYIWFLRLVQCLRPAVLAQVWLI